MKTIRVPGSKNLSLRSMVIASLARGQSRITGLVDSDDTRVAREALSRLGARIDGDSITGVDGAPRNPGAALDVCGSGVMMRFLTAIAALAPGAKTIRGNARMHERPIHELVRGLRQLGVDCSCADTGCPPVSITSCGIRGGEVTMDGSVSSQYFSALAIAAPYADGAVTIHAQGQVVSQAFIEETIDIMNAFGASGARFDGTTITIPHGEPYSAQEYAVPGDWVAASYWMAYAAVQKESVRIEGLDFRGGQADRAVLEVIEEMGCAVTRENKAIVVTGKPLRGVSVTDGRLVDSALTVMMLGLFAKGVTRFRNIRHLRHKESDRIHEMAQILTRLGARVKEYEDGLDITGTACPRGAEIDPANDHRLAMCAGIASTAIPGVRVTHPACVAKSYPAFWKELERLQNAL